MAQTETQTLRRTTVAPPLPSPVREAWGDTAADAFTDWMETAVLPHVVPRDEYREILSRMDVLESRMDGLERAVVQNRREFHQRLDGMRAETQKQFQLLREEFNLRLDGMRAETQKQFQLLREEFNLRLDGMRTEFREELHEHWREIHERFDRMNERFDQMYDRMLVQTRWMIGSLTVIGALVTFLLAIGTFAK